MLVADSLSAHNISMVLLGLRLYRFAEKRYITRECGNEEKQMNIYRGQILVVFIVSFLLCLSSTFVFAAKDQASSQSTNKYNVVFVVDESGSMKSTDKGKARYDAIDMFLSLMAREGNSVGSVTFNDSVIHEQPVKAVKKKEDKDAFSKNIKEHSSSKGDTDIGEALQAAVKLLDEGRNPKIPSAIILLTDGNTDLDNNPNKESKEEEKSHEDKAQAIDQARDLGYQIYTVCLNENGSADISETKQIASATGGQSAEVNSPDDLEDVYSMFYSMIFGGEIPPPELINGTKTFDVPNAGVEEANILIHGKFNSCRITDPSGTDYGKAEVSKIKSLTIEKIYKPDPGKWTVKVEGDKNTKILYNLVYNYDFVVADTTKVKKSYGEGETIPIKAELTTNDSTRISEGDQQEFDVKAVFLDANDKVIDEKPMTANGAGFDLAYKIPDRNSFSYYISAQYASGEKYGNVEKKTKPRQIVVSNTAPVSNGDIEETIKVWPIKGGEYVLDMTTLARDNEDKTLNYTIRSSAFIDKAEDPENGDYSVKNNTLVQDHFSLRKGSYIIRCADSGGLYCDVKVTINSINIGLLAAIGFGVIGLVVLIILLVGAYMAATRPLLGELRVRSTGMDEPMTRDRGRGKFPLRTFGVPQPSLQKGYIQATGKDHVLLVPKTVLYLNGSPVEKQIEIRNSPMETILYLDQEGREQLSITFRSALDGRRGGPRRRGNPISDLIGSITGIFSGIGNRGGSRRSRAAGGDYGGGVPGGYRQGGAARGGRVRRTKPPKTTKGRAKHSPGSGSSSPYS